MAFDKNEHLIKVQGGRTYLPVAWRLVWFREEHPDWGIVTEPLDINHEKQYAVFRATIFNAEGKIMATGTKKEDVKGFGDWTEKAETGAVGRALAMCGYGTQFEPDMDDAPRPGAGPQEERPPMTTAAPAPETAKTNAAAPPLTKDQKAISEQLRAMEKPVRNEWALWAKNTFGVNYVSELTPPQAAQMNKTLKSATGKTQVTPEGAGAAP